MPSTEVRLGRGTTGQATEYGKLEFELTAELHVAEVESCCSVIHIKLVRW